MHAEKLAYMPYPQLDGEASSTNESMYRNYPHARPVAIEDLSVEDKEILNSVSLAGDSVIYMYICCPSELTLALTLRTLDHPRTSCSRSRTPRQDAPLCGHL